MVKSVVLIALLLRAGSLLAQSDSESRPSVPSNAAPPMLQRPYEAVRDFMNFYAFADDTYDSNGYYVNGANSGGGDGLLVGGGASGFRQWSTGVLELTYRGEYHEYQNKAFPNGTDQNLSLLFRKDFSRRFSFRATESGYILNNSGIAYSNAPNASSPATLVQTNPFSSETRFTGTDLSVTYQKTARLSFNVSGSYFITRYSGLFAYGSNAIGGSASADYRVTRKTTVSGSYSRNHFVYKHKGGSSDVDNVFLTVAHSLAKRWTASAAAGFSRAASSGFVQIPLNLQIGQQIVTVIGTGKYSEGRFLPYYQGTLLHDLRHDSVSLSGGQSVSPGNGYYLASRTLGFNGLWIHNLKRSNLSCAGYYSRLTSVSNAISIAETTRGIGVSYSYNLIHHVGLNARYDFLNYSSFGSYGGRSDNRITFGVYVSSKDIPLGLF